MSNVRHASESAVIIRSFGVTFQHDQTILPPQVVPRGYGKWHLLIYATRGVITVRAEQSAWVVPPHRGVWIPAGFKYRVELSGVVALRMLYIRAGKRRWPRVCAVVNVTPLLRELIVRTVLIGALQSNVAAQKRLIGVIFDELSVMRTVPLQLPLPQDRRAARFATMMSEDPEAFGTALRECGGSRRTMERVFRSETGMSLGQWMRRQKLLLALRRIAAGESVKTIALDLGYNGASAFIAMFRRELGQTPKKYFES
jgi:AraC-like DNA-binding protein